MVKLTVCVILPILQLSWLIIQHLRPHPLPLPDYMKALCKTLYQNILLISTTRTKTSSFNSEFIQLGWHHQRTGSTTISAQGPVPSAHRIQYHQCTRSSTISAQGPVPSARRVQYHQCTGSSTISAQGPVPSVHRFQYHQRRGSSTISAQGPVPSVHRVQCTGSSTISTPGYWVDSYLTTKERTNKINIHEIAKNFVSVNGRRKNFFGEYV